MSALWSGPKLFNSNWKVRLNVSTTNQKKITYNTIGILRGSMEDGTLYKLKNISSIYLKFVSIHIRSLRPVG